MLMQEVIRCVERRQYADIILTTGTRPTTLLYSIYIIIKYIQATIIKMNITNIYNIVAYYQLLLYKYINYFLHIPSVLLIIVNKTLVAAVLLMLK